MSGQDRLSERLRDVLRAVLGAEGYLDDEAARYIYARDASHMTLGLPRGVALPATPQEVVQVMAICAAAGVPVVARGSGTGLSGGALPPDGSLVLATGRLQKMGAVNAAWGSVQVEVGVLNEKVSTHAKPFSFHFAPDPSSQSASAIGGNIAENAGGPHCLRHGVTLRHLRRLEWVGADGQQHQTGEGTTGQRGLDLVSLLCGSEGTLGIVTTADLKLVSDPASVSTLLAFFPVLDEATLAVVKLLGQGLLPVAVEMVDQSMLIAVEAAFSFGFPTDVEAAMIVEFNGTVAEVTEDGTRAETLLREAGAREVRQAADDDERAELWKCRKKAFGAVGRLAPSYVTMDVVVPLGHLPGLVREIQTIKTRHNVEVATAFHAGDGNLHPGVHYDDRDPEATRRAHTAADEIIGAALARGGSATGEHGVGIEKLHVLPWQMDAVTARLHQDIKHIFDPVGLLNPGKLLPDPAAQYAPLKAIPETVTFAWESLTVTAPAATRLSAIQEQALARGFWLPVGLPGQAEAYGLGHDPTVAELLDHLVPGPSLFASGTARDFLLESWAATGDGQLFHSGAPVFKNVAGYGLPQMLCGSGGLFVRHLAATFALRPRPERALVLKLVGSATDLSPLWAWLATRNDGLAEAQVAVDPDEGVFVLITGRDRPWDLGQARDDLAACLSPDGWQVTVAQAGPFAEMAGWLAGSELPPWLLSSPQWNSLAPCTTQLTTDNGLDSADRHLRQAQSGLTWTPDALPSESCWRSEMVTSKGALTGLSRPTPGVPLPILQGLKNVFDPDGALPCPAWLASKEASDE